MASDATQGAKDAFVASRPLSWINTAAPFLLGYLLGAGRLDAMAIGGFLYFLIPYNLMLYGVNDIYDYESDVNNPRKGKLEGAVIARERHRRLWLAIIALNVPALTALATLGGPAAKAWLAFAIFMNLAYSLKGLRFKEVPVLDSITSSTHFFAPLVYGLLLSGAVEWYPAAIAAFVLWGMASHAFGAVQDIVYDRSAGIGSVAVSLGTRTTLWACFITYVVAALLPVMAYGAAGVVVAPFLGLYAYNVGRFLWVRRDAEAAQTNRGWKNFLFLNLVAGFWITQCLLVVFDPFDLGQEAMRTHMVVLGVIGVALLVVSALRVQRTTRRPTT